ncbi:MAG: hypothetical protein GVY10_07435 [Verrucomicrobia bacterium]|jgi:hypothetical protein|nr:hypothetical protein [Verrucomicrobiota bacterium]
MRKTDDHQKVTLEALLRVKREEAPGESFWDSFESEFQRRRLQALVGKPSLRERIWKPALKSFSLAVPLLALAAVFIARENVGPFPAAPSTASAVAVNHQPQPAAKGQAESEEVALAQGGSEPLSSTSGRTQFVVDALQEESAGRLDFRKVLYTPAIHVSSSPQAKYVQDSFRSGGYRVTTTDHDLGRNF